MPISVLPGTDLATGPMCLGMGGFGSGGVKGDDATRAIERALAADVRFFDTAHCYAFWSPEGAGCSERELGRCVRELGCRDRVVVATKGGHPAVEPDYPRPDMYLAPEVIASDVTESLGWLGFDTIDLYLLHRDDTRVPVGEIIDTLNREIAAGRVRYLGASNWSVERIEAANAYAASHGLRGFCCSQVHFSLADPKWEIGPDPTMRNVTTETAALYERSALPIMAYTASAGGYFAGRESAEGSYATPRNAARRERARQLADELDCTPAQVALAYLICQPFPVVPIVGTFTHAHLLEAIAAPQIALTAQQVAWLRDGEPS